MLVYEIRRHVRHAANLSEVSRHPHSADGAVFREPEQCDAVRSVRSRLDAGLAAVHGDHRTHLFKVRRCVYAISGLVHSGITLRPL